MEYISVKEALTKANNIDTSLYDESVKVLQEAVASVVAGKNITEQTTVIGHANTINDALDALVYKETSNTTASNNPQTSDNVSYMIYVVGIVLSGLYVVSRRRKYNQ